MEYAIIGAVALLVFIFITIIVKVDSIRTKANALFLEAEKNITEDKFEYVCENLYSYLPAIAKIFINEDTFKVIVQKLYDETRNIASDLLDDGKLNKSVIKKANKFEADVVENNEKEEE